MMQVKGLISCDGLITKLCVTIYHINVAETVHLTSVIPESLAGKRLDQALAILFPEHSRARLQQWIRNDHVQLNRKPSRQKARVQSGDVIEINATYEPSEVWEAENIPLEILYEDKQLLVVNKPAGLVVHPGAGNPQHTLLNALLHYDPELEYVPRAGIVQRLDKDTSGVMVIARTPEAHTRLVAALQARDIHREYQTIVSGVMTAGGSVDQPIGRHPRKRTRMAVVENGKNAVSHYRIIKKYRAHTHLRVTLQTGRTHQIRVHMSWLKYPIVGDPMYAGRLQLPKNASNNLVNLLQKFPRQALHASAIRLTHPLTGNILTCESPLPDDMQQLLVALNDDTRNA